MDCCFWDVCCCPLCFVLFVPLPFLVILSLSCSLFLAIVPSLALSVLFRPHSCSLFRLRFRCSFHLFLILPLSLEDRAPFVFQLNTRPRSRVTQKRRRSVRESATRGGSGAWFTQDASQENWSCVVVCDKASNDLHRLLAPQPSAVNLAQRSHSSESCRLREESTSSTIGPLSS